MVWLSAEIVGCPAASMGCLPRKCRGRPGARFTTTFEDTGHGLVSRAAMPVLAEFVRTMWKSVHAIVERVVAGLAGKTDQLPGLTRIWIDEIAYRKGQRYLTFVVDGMG